MIKYTKDHEYIRVEGDIGFVGISNFAQGQLGDVVFVDPPAVGRKVAQKEVVAVVESVKAASDIYAPVSGEIIEQNSAVVETPAQVNTDAEGNAWFFKIVLSNMKELDGLMDKAAYDKFCATV